MVAIFKKTLVLFLISSLCQNIQTTNDTTEVGNKKYFGINRYHHQTKHAHPRLVLNGVSQLESEAKRSILTKTFKAKFSTGFLNIV